MKIALITIFKSTNYGAVLQAYATKKAFSKFGEVQIIDYNNKYLTKNYRLIRFDFSIHGVKMLIHDVLRLPYSIRQFSKFNKFINSNLNSTRPLTSKELVRKEAGSFDVYICGSDQIWNPEILNKNKILDPIYFLSFAPTDYKKIAFASSIGHHKFTIKEKKKLKVLLNDFTKISTREIDGKEKLKEILPNKRIEHINDPTLLLSKEEWLNTFKIKPRKSKKDYILVYSVPHSDLMKKAVQFFSKKLKLKVITIDKMLIPFTKTDKHIRDAGPINFIELYANAKFVITDSFHGTCFSVNFGKSFVSISPDNKSNRIHSLLTILGIENRLISSEKEFETLNLNMDFERTHIRLNAIRKKSIQFIENAMLP